ncbi:Beta-galactosidase trimerisation domain protein, partial [mine drainage metagenome]
MSYASRWAIDFQRQSVRYRQLDVLLDYYRPLEDLTHSVDIVSARAPLQRYKIVFAPSLNVISAKLARHLRRYVLGGGVLVLGPRSGMKDRYNRLNVERQPGPLVPLLGGRVQQYYALVSRVSVSGSMGRGTGRIWAEALTPHSSATRVLLRYGAGNAWLSGTPAALEHRYGRRNHLSRHDSESAPHARVRCA